MSSLIPVSQYPLPPSYCLQVGSEEIAPPAPPQGGDVNEVLAFSGSIPRSKLVVDQSDTSYRDVLKRLINELLRSSMKLIGDVPSNDAEIFRRVGIIDAIVTEIFEKIESYKYHEAKSSLRSLLISNLSEARRVESALQRAADEAEASLAELS